jgi:hypothetical protein
MESAQSPIDANIARSPQNGLGRLAAWRYDHRRRVLLVGSSPWWPSSGSRSGQRAEASQPWGHDPGSTNGAIKVPNSPDETARA